MQWLHNIEGYILNNRFDFTNLAEIYAHFD